MKHKRKRIIKFGKNSYVYFWCDVCEIDILKEQWINGVHKKEMCDKYKRNLKIRRKAEGRVLKAIN